MNALLLLVHGWGFGADFWAPLRARFTPDETLTWDLGFFGAPERPLPPPDRPVIAVGHSFGFLWLLRHRPVDWDRLVSINGFTCFAKRPDFAQGVSRRLLERMQAPAERHARPRG